MFAAVLFSVAFLSLQALAAEVFLGRIGSIDGGAASNQLDSGTPFYIPLNAKISVQCSEASYVGVFGANSTVTAQNGVKVAADALFQTSTPASSTHPTPVVSIMPVSVVVDAGCKVFDRRGNE